MSKLNLETFNNILFTALKDQSIEGQIELIEIELTTISDILWDEMGLLMEELEDNGYESERFKKILNIKANTEPLIDKLKELEKKKEQQA